MPNIANLTVKKNDGTTNIVYDALSGSGADSAPAVWRQDTGNTPALPYGLRASLKFLTQWNAKRTARRLTLNYVAPYAVQDSTTTLYSAKDQVIVTLSVVAPQAIPPAAINEAIAQATNCFVDPLIRTSMQSGFSPS